MDKLKLLAIVGPTASGKTGLAINLAKKYNGAIISADSRTVYKGLDIGTAKPSIEQRQGIRHYGFDLVNPDQSFSVAAFIDYAKIKINEISQQGKIPILVGGSGLYIDALLYDFKMPRPNAELRSKLQSLSNEQLIEAITKKKLPMPNNKKNKLHLVSTLERNGQLPSRSNKLPIGYHIIGLNPKREALTAKIETRAQLMVDAGVVAEAKNLFLKYGKRCTPLQTGIYKALLPYLEQQEPLGMCLVNVVRSDKNLAKRQITWFKRNKDIVWYENADQAMKDNCF